MSAIVASVTVSRVRLVWYGSLNLVVISQSLSYLSCLYTAQYSILYTTQLYTHNHTARSSLGVECDAGSLVARSPIRRSPPRTSVLTESRSNSRFGTAARPTGTALARWPPVAPLPHYSMCAQASAQALRMRHHCTMLALRSQAASVPQHACVVSYKRRSDPNGRQESSLL